MSCSSLGCGLVAVVKGSLISVLEGRFLNRGRDGAMAKKRRRWARGASGAGAEMYLRDCIENHSRRR